MKCTSRLARFFGIIFITGGLFVALSGCESPGPVGNSLAGSETELSVDTLQIGAIDTESLNAYSGQRNFFSLGQFDDPLFGNVKTTAYLRPNLPAATSSDTMEENAGMKLRLLFDTGQAYGDTLQPGTFEIYEIAQRWRGKALRLKDPLSLDDSYQVGSFTLENEDSLDVSLNQEWISKYRTHFVNSSENRDSTYKENFFGLAIIPQDNSKILPLRPGSTRFVIENPEADTFDVSSDQWAYNLEREEGITYPEDSGPLFSTYEQILNFDIGFQQMDLSVSNISKVELVFYENVSALEAAETVRPTINNMRLHLVSPSQVPANIDPGNPLAIGSYDEDNRAYRFNITSFAKSALLSPLDPDERFYLVISNNGVVKSTLLYLDGQVQSAKAPQLIITSVQNRNSAN